MLQKFCVTKSKQSRAWMGIFLHYNVTKIPHTHPTSCYAVSFCMLLLSGIFFLILVQLEIPVESDQSFSEQGSPGNTSHSIVLSTDASLQEEKAQDVESSSVPVRAQEPSAATGSGFSYSMHFLRQLTLGVLFLYKC